MSPPEFLNQHVSIHQKFSNVDWVIAAFFIIINSFVLRVAFDFVNKVEILRKICMTSLEIKI
jgi:hypothetical protein